MFLPARKLKKKEEIEENYITTFDTLNLGAFANLKKKNYFEDCLSKSQFKIEYFFHLPDMYMTI